MINQKSKANFALFALAVIFFAVGGGGGVLVVGDHDHGLAQVAAHRGQGLKQ